MGRKSLSSPKKAPQYRGGNRVLQCQVCGKKDGVGPDKVRLKLCARCRGAAYCGPECQRDGWKRHRALCVQLSFAQLPPPSPSPKLPHRNTGARDTVQHHVNSTSDGRPVEPFKLKLSLEATGRRPQPSPAPSPPAQMAPLQREMGKKTPPTPPPPQMERLNMPRRSRAPPEQVSVAGRNSLEMKHRRRQAFTGNFPSPSASSGPPPSASARRRGLTDRGGDCDTGEGMKPGPDGVSTHTIRSETARNGEGSARVDPRTRKGDSHSGRSHDSSRGSSSEDLNPWAGGRGSVAPRRMSYYHTSGSVQPGAEAMRVLRESSPTSTERSERRERRRRANKQELLMEREARQGPWEEDRYHGHGESCDSEVPRRLPSRRSPNSARSPARGNAAQHNAGFVQLREEDIVLRDARGSDSSGNQRDRRGSGKARPSPPSPPLPPRPLPRKETQRSRQTSNFLAPGPDPAVSHQHKKEQPVAKASQESHAPERIRVQRKSLRFSSGLKGRGQSLPPCPPRPRPNSYNMAHTSERSAVVTVPPFLPAVKSSPHLPPTPDLPGPRMTHTAAFYAQSPAPIGCLPPPTATYVGRPKGFTVHVLVASAMSLVDLDSPRVPPGAHPALVAARKERALGPKSDGRLWEYYSRRERGRVAGALRSGDVILLTPGRYEASMWGLYRLHSSVEVIGVGPAQDCVVYNSVGCGEHYMIGLFGGRHSCAGARVRGGVQGQETSLGVRGDVRLRLANLFLEQGSGYRGTVYQLGEGSHCEVDGCTVRCTQGGLNFEEGSCLVTDSTITGSETFAVHIRDEGSIEHCALQGCGFGGGSRAGGLAEAGGALGPEGEGESRSQNQDRREDDGMDVNGVGGFPAVSLLQSSWVQVRLCIILDNAGHAIQCRDGPLPSPAPLPLSPPPPPEGSSATEMLSSEGEKSLAAQAQLAAEKDLREWLGAATALLKPPRLMRQCHGGEVVADMNLCKGNQRCAEKCHGEGRGGVCPGSGEEEGLPLPAVMTLRFLAAMDEGYLGAIREERDAQQVARAGRGGAGGTGVGRAKAREVKPEAGPTAGAVAGAVAAAVAGAGAGAGAGD